MLFNNKNRVYVIAELSANHNNDFDLAKETIKAMKESGADAVKFQTYTADSMTIDCDNEYFGPRTEGLWKGMKLYDIFNQGAMPYEWQKELSKYAISLKMDWLSSPFDAKAVDFLESINCPVYKIASLEIFDIPLIDYVATKGKPVILSTGVAEKDDIELAVSVLKKRGVNDISILKCTSAYPTPIEEVNLHTIKLMQNDFDCIIGLSDHTMGHIVPIAAVALGARIVEKHFVLNRLNGGIDASFSMEPDEFAVMVKSIRDAELAMGKAGYELSPAIKATRLRARSLFVVEDVKAGEVFSEKNVRAIRPGYGLHPKLFNEILGKKAKVDIKKGTPLSFQLLS
jgi:pseudaminic acid synthase